METVYRSVAGIDVHKKMLAVVIRRERGEQVEYEKRQFGANRADIQHLVAWLQAHGVSEVVMESTAQYGRPVWNGLEPHFRLHLTHPLKTRAPRGRKFDFRRAASGAPVERGGLAGELRSGQRAEGLALADQKTGAIKERIERGL
jgi:hypothetical protein